MESENSTVDGISPIPTVNVNEAIQDRLKRFILEQRLGAGSRLPPEGRLSQSLGVSRPALREALRALEALGTVESRVGSGWYVREFSFDSITRGLAYDIELNHYSFVHLSQLRVGLECGFIDDTVRHLTPEVVEKLQDAVEVMEQAASDGDGYLYTEKDHYFHRTLFSGVKNPLLDSLMEVFWTLYDYLCPEATPAPGLEADARRHRLILDAVMAGNVDLARQRLRESDESSPYNVLEPKDAGDR